MKRYLLPALLLAGFFLTGRYWSELSVHAGGGGAFGGNGDVNGDGFRNITDVISFLNWMYLGGSPPVACADGGGLTPDQLEALSHISMVDLPDGKGRTVRTIRISGANLQIVNGTGDTETSNGLGNLIVGYQILRGGGSVNDRTGSHTVVVGNLNNYSRFGGLVVGVWNSVAGNYSSVSGGISNDAIGAYSSVSGGQQGDATGYCSSITGGFAGQASGESSSVSGGSSNKATARFASVSGGGSNVASQEYASVSGGIMNEASGSGASVSGGGTNKATANVASVSGGSENTASGVRSSVSGGVPPRDEFVVPADPCPRW